MAKKSKTVLSRKYMYNILVEAYKEADSLDGVFRAATGSNTFTKPTDDLGKAVDFLGGKILKGDKLGNAGRETLVSLVSAAHGAFKSTRGVAIRSDAQCVIEHSLFRLMQRMGEDNVKRACRK